MFTNKLLAQWQGLYQIVTRIGKSKGKVDVLDMHDRRKRKRVFHVNICCRDTRYEL